MYMFYLQQHVRRRKYHPPYVSDFCLPNKNVDIEFISFISTFFSFLVEIYFIGGKNDCKNSDLNYEIYGQFLEKRIFM